MENETPLIRTGASDAVWEQVKRGFQTPSSEDFLANVSIIEDSKYLGMSPARVIASLPESTHRSVVFICDDETGTGDEQLVLAVEANTKPLESFRLIVSEAWNVENNLSLANMGWEEFVEALDDKGVFRGFEQCDFVTWRNLS